MIIALPLAGTFALSGVAKLFDLRQSVRVTRNVGILPNPLDTIFGLSIPFIELLLCLWLILLPSPFAYGAALLLLLSFLIANIKVWFHDMEVSCNCFGKWFDGNMGKGSAINNGYLILYCILLFIWPNAPIHKLLPETSASEWMYAAIPAIGLGLVPMLVKTIDSMRGE